MRRYKNSALRFATLALSLLLFAACGGGGSDDDHRVAFVEVTSSPSGLPVEVTLNNTSQKATTPVMGNMRYDAICGLPTGCLIVGLARLDTEAPSRVTLCVTDGGKRACDSSTTGLASVGLDFDT